MGRPNFNAMQRQQRLVAQHVGETAQLRTFVSAGSISQRAEAAGYGATYYYQGRIITGLFQAAVFGKYNVAGGQFMAGDVIATFVDAMPSARDEITWRGVTYIVQSDPQPQAIVGKSAFRVLLRRGDATG
jgi:hypothetical protein